MNPQDQRRILGKDESSTPPTQKKRSMPHDHHLDATNHKDAPECPPPHHVPCRTTSKGQDEPLSTPCRRIAPTQKRRTPLHTRPDHPQHIEEHLLHTPGDVPPPRTGTPPTPHPHDSSPPPPPKHHAPLSRIHPEREHPFGSIHSHLHADPRNVPHKRHKGQADIGKTPITPTSTTRTQTVPRAQPHPAPQPNMSLMSPRGTQGAHPLAPPITPASPLTQERHTTRTPPVPTSSAPPTTPR